MSSEPIVQTISSGSEQRMNVPVVTVEAFFQGMPSRFSSSWRVSKSASTGAFGNRRLIGPASPWPGSIPISLKNASRFSARQNNPTSEFVGPPAAGAVPCTCSQKDPCTVVASRGFHLAPKFALHRRIRRDRVFRTPMINEVSSTLPRSRFRARFFTIGDRVRQHGRYSRHRRPDPRDERRGQNECVLGLIERGYSLVADDLTKIKSARGPRTDGHRA